MRGGSKQEIEATGADVEDAIIRGLARLGVSREKAQIEVLDEGSRGLLGLGRRDAIVRLRVIGAQSQPASEAPKKAETPVDPPARPPTRAPKPQTTEKRPPARESSSAPARPPRRERSAAPPPRRQPKKQTPRPAPKPRTVVPFEMTDEVRAALAAETEAATAVLQTLLGKVQVEGTITSALSEPDEMTGRQIPIIEINGDDLSLLIGPRGDTLNALQFITRIIVAHQLKQRTTLVLDVEGYRDRRGQALARLAERMADKALKRGRPVTLEPMPPNERRAIHMALRSVDGVYTESTGEGNGRRVRILLR